jgi:hypothetical protein
MTRCIAILLTVALPLAFCTAARPGEKDGKKEGLSTKGQITLTAHKMKMDKDVPHVIEVQGKGFTPRVTIPGAFLSFTSDFKNPNDFKGTFTPTQTQEYAIVVLPDFFGSTPEGGTLDYTLKVTPIRLAEKPMLKVAAKLTEQDMKVEGKDTYFKSYPIKLKAGQVYVIDMQRDPAVSKIDPFLYLKDGKQTVAQDDDSGGNLNARIIYTAPKDGEFTVIATTLFPATGDFTLTVRGPAEGKDKAEKE